MVKSYYKKSKKGYGILRNEERKVYFKKDSLWILNEDFLKTEYSEN